MLFNTVSTSYIWILKSERKPEDLNRHCFPEDIEMANRHVKSSSAWLASREMQLKTTVSCRLTPVRTASIKKPTVNECWRECGEKETLLGCWCKRKLV